MIYSLENKIKIFNAAPTKRRTGNLNILWNSLPAEKQVELNKVSDKTINFNHQRVEFGRAINNIRLKISRIYRMQPHVIKILENFNESNDYDVKFDLETLKVGQRLSRLKDCHGNF